ncbi:MAG: NHL repeat-containing protein, partial [Acidobacteriota bacterium]|nr:NHL repeat-containing protein [Acidobacteriota bacterium]
MIIRRLISLLSVCIFSIGVASAQTLNPKPVKALGAPRLLATQANPGALDSTNPNYIEGKELFNPTAIALDPSSNPPAVYVADTTNNRVLGWKYSSQLTNGAPADVVLGQKDFFSTLPQGPGGLVTGLNAPTGVTVDKSGNVYVADTGNNRILRFPQPFTQRDSPKPVDLILGQSGFNSSNPNPQGVLPTSLFLNNQQGFPPHVGLALSSTGDLFVTDPGNNRVLRYPAAGLNAGQNGAAADLQLGQATFTSNSLAPANRGDKTALSAPTSLAFDSAGRLFVGDSAARVLVYAPGFVTRTAAARILGVVVGVPNQPPPPAVSAINIGFAGGVTIGPGNRPVVVDTVNSRVLVYDSFDNFPAESPTSL